MSATRKPWSIQQPSASESKQASDPDDDTSCHSSDGSSSQSGTWTLSSSGGASSSCTSTSFSFFLSPSLSVTTSTSAFDDRRPRASGGDGDKLRNVHSQKTRADVSAASGTSPSDAPVLSTSNQTKTTSRIYSPAELPFAASIRQTNALLPVGVQSFAFARTSAQASLAKSCAPDEQITHWLLIGGRTNGLHTFSTVTENFPAQEQNTDAIVLTQRRKRTSPSEAAALDTHVSMRSLRDPHSGLTSAQVDLLSVTAAQFCQVGKVLYIAGGYGIDSETKKFTTKDSLSAILVEGMVDWVLNPANLSVRASQFVLQAQNSLCKVTGGEMIAFPGADNSKNVREKRKGHGAGKLEPADNRTADGDGFVAEGDRYTIPRVKNLRFLLVMGQQFDGEYLQGATQEYTQQIRRFCVSVSSDAFHGTHTSPQLTVRARRSIPLSPGNPNFRRRDMNLVPYVAATVDPRNSEKSGDVQLAALQLSGVFTPSNGVWTIPVSVSEKGTPTELNFSHPHGATPFRQGMNNYDCAKVALYSRQRARTYILLFGGLSYLTYNRVTCEFVADSNIPFVNQCTVIEADHAGHCRQFLLDAEFPLILSGRSPPAERLHFGATAAFLPAGGLQTIGESDIVDLDATLGSSTSSSSCHDRVGALLPVPTLRRPVFLGTVVGGIQSSLPNTSQQRQDTAASPYMFDVSLLSLV